MAHPVYFIFYNYLDIFNYEYINLYKLCKTFIQFTFVWQEIFLLNIQHHVIFFLEKLYTCSVEAIQLVCTDQDEIRWKNIV